MPEFDAVLAWNIRVERVRHGWHQNELARRVGGWRITTVSEVERGARRLLVKELPQLCRALGVTLGQLAHGADVVDLAALGVDSDRVIGRPAADSTGRPPSAVDIPETAWFRAHRSSLRTAAQHLDDRCLVLALVDGGR